MAYTADAIIGELTLKYQQYIQDADRVIAKNKELSQSMVAGGGDGKAMDQAITRQVASRKKLTDAEKAAAAEENRAAKEKANVLKQAAREEAAAQKSAARDAAAAVKAAEREKQAAIAATTRAAEQAAARQAELDASAAKRVIHDRSPSPGSGGILGATSEPGTRATVSRQSALMSGTSVGASSAAGIAAEREVNQSLIQRIELQERLKVASAEEAGIIRQQLTEINLATGYERAGLEAKEAALRLDRELVVIEGQRAERAAEALAANQAAITQLELRARIASATSKAEAASLSDQIAAVRQLEAYKALGLSRDEAVAKVAAETLALEEKRTAAAAEQAAIVERQMRAQQGAIANKISGAGLAASALVGGLGVAEISHLNDRYIELSNSLKVAGVSASEFDEVQQHLLATANKNGTNINALADVFRSASLGAHDLGLSQKDLLTVTDAASNALRIQGVSSEQARGALLQLGHAFESPRVNAREFNSLALNLYPLLQAAARGSDKFGGSVAKLRAEIIAGTVSGGDFAKSIIAASEALAERADKATLTTAQGFTSLSNALIVYFGEADKAQGISAALGGALQELGANLGTLIPALAAIGTALTVGYITRMTTAALATRTLGASILGAFGGPVGLAVTAVGLAIAGTVVEVNDARLAADQAATGLKALQDQFGESGKAATVAGSGIHNVGTDALGAIPHVNAFAGAVGNLAQQLYNQARAARAARVEQLQGQLQASQQKETDLQAKLPGGLNGTLRRGDASGNFATVLRSGYGRVTNFLSGGYQDQDNRKAYSDQVQQSLLLQRQVAQAKAAPITASDIPGQGSTGGTLDAASAKALARLNDKLTGLEQLVGGATGKRLDRIKAQITNTKAKIADIQEGASPAAASAAEGGGGAGRGGPSADTLAKRAEAARRKAVNDQADYDAALRRAQSAYLEQQADLTNDAGKRADVERDRVKFERDQYAKEIAADGPVKDGGTGKYTAEGVTKLQKLNTDTADLHLQQIDQGERIRIADETRSIDVANLENEKTRLQSQEELADTLAQRRAIAKQILDIEYQEKEKALAAVLAYDSKASASDKQNALAQLQLLPGQKADDLKNLDRQNEGTGASYLRGLSGDRQQIIEGTEVKTLQSFNQELDHSVSKALHLHGIFGSIVDDLIDMAVKQALIKPLANGLFGGSGGSGGGGFGGLLKGLIGGASKLFGGGGGGAGLSAFSTDFGTGLSSDISGLGGWATGGSGVIGGNAGIDQNVLSLNGNPIRKVGKGELLTVSPTNAVSPNQQVAPGQAGGGDTHYHVSVLATNNVAPEGFAKDLAANILNETDRRIGRASNATVRATPGYVSKTSALRS